MSALSHCLPSGLVIAITTLGLLGCPADSEDVRPPADEFYFPTGLAASPDESTIFVVNANSDLRFASGSIIVMRTSAINALAEAWVENGEVPDGCDRDNDLGFLINCDETLVTRANASVRLASFATQIGVQELADGAIRLFVPSRGDPSVTYIDVEEDGNLECGGSGSHPICADSYRLSQLRDDPEIGRLIEEPFGVFVDSEREYVLISHLTSGTVTAVDAPASGARPVISDLITGIFAASPTSGISGAVGIAGRRPGSDNDLIYVTSRTDNRIQLLSVARPGFDGLPRLATGDFFFLDQVQPADESREIAFSADGDRAYVVNREPPLLHVIDTSGGTDGKPVNRFIGGVELCPEAANLTILDSGQGEKVYVSCFRNGQIWAIDPVGLVVEGIIEVGRGPNSLLGVPSRGWLLVSNFLEDTIAVVDVRPGSATENRFVIRLGRIRQEDDL